MDMLWMWFVCPRDILTKRARTRRIISGVLGLPNLEYCWTVKRPWGPLWFLRVGEWLYLFIRGVSDLCQMIPEKELEWARSRFGWVACNLQISSSDSDIIGLTNRKHTKRAVVNLFFIKRSTLVWNGGASKGPILCVCRLDQEVTVTYLCGFVYAKPTASIARTHARITARMHAIDRRENTYLLLKTHERPCVCGIKSYKFWSEVSGSHTRRIFGWHTAQLFCERKGWNWNSAAHGDKAPQLALVHDVNSKLE